VVGSDTGPAVAEQSPPKTAACSETPVPLHQNDSSDLVMVVQLSCIYAKH